MKQGIIIYQHADSEKNRYFIDLCLKKLNSEGFSLTYIDEEELDGYLAEQQIDYAIYRGRNYTISEKLVALNTRVFNPPTTNQIANDKHISCKLFNHLGLPSIDTQVIPNDLSYPYIMKSVDGHGGKEVFLINDDNKRLRLLAKYPTKKFIYQPFIANDGDLRIYLVNQKYVASVARHNSKDFRHNFSLGGDVILYNPSEKLIKEAEMLAHELKADFIGVDLFLVGEKYLFNEIEDPVGCRMLYKLSNIDIISLFVNHIKKELSKE